MAQVEIGGIYRAVAADRGAPAALVLVTAVDAATRSTVVLLSPDIQFGSSRDLVLSGPEIGRGYDLLAQCDILGHLRVGQLDRRIGGVDARVAEDLRAVRAGESSSRPPAGPPVVERSDPRWAFKVAELNRLRRLHAASGEVALS
jgi:hypothetical protein